MEELKNEIKAMIIEQKGFSVSNMDIYLAMDIYKDMRNYPTNWSESKILEDMNRNKYKIAMASIEIDSKEGVESQTADSENGHSRTYSVDLIAYSHVIGYVR